MKNQIKTIIFNMLDKIKNKAIIRIIATIDRIFFDYKILIAWYDYAVETNKTMSQISISLNDKSNSVKKNEFEKNKKN